MKLVDLGPGLGDTVRIRFNAAKDWTADWQGIEAVICAILIDRQGVPQVWLRTDDGSGDVDGFALEDLEVVKRALPAQPAQAGSEAVVVRADMLDVAAKHGASSELLRYLIALPALASPPVPQSTAPGLRRAMEISAVRQIIESHRDKAKMDLTWHKAHGPHSNNVDASIAGFKIGYLNSILRAIETLEKHS